MWVLEKDHETLVAQSKARRKKLTLLSFISFIASSSGCHTIHIPCCVHVWHSLASKFKWQIHLSWQLSKQIVYTHIYCHKRDICEDWTLQMQWQSTGETLNRLIWKKTLMSFFGTGLVDLQKLIVECLWFKAMCSLGGTFFHYRYVLHTSVCQSWCPRSNQKRHWRTRAGMQTWRMSCQHWAQCFSPQDISYTQRQIW